MPEPPDVADSQGAAGLLDRFAPYYDLEYDAYDADLDFYRNYAQEAVPWPGGAARVLEVACGSGRVLVALAAAGHLCTGVDASPAMLHLAGDRATRAGVTAAVRLVEARMEALPPALGPLDLAICALNSFSYLLTQADQLAMLGGVRAALAPGGRLLIDCSPVDPDGPFPAAGELIHQGTWARPGGGQVLKFVTGAWDLAEQHHHVVWIYDETDAAGHLRRTAIPQTLRYVFRWEASLLLERAGFTLDAVYGSYDLDPYASGAPRLLLVARRPG